MDLNDLIFDFNKLIIHPQFEDTLKEVSSMTVSLPNYQEKIGYSLDELTFTNGELVIPVDKIDRVRLSPEKGIKMLERRTFIAAYDESISKFDSLEGSAFFTSHSLSLMDKFNYIPVNYITFYFYTKSQEIVKKSKYIKLSYEPEIDSKKDYILDRIAFLERAMPKYSLLLIDGPLIGGDVYTYMIRSIEIFHKKEIIPIFIVKNSTSNLVTDNVEELQNKYNSDMHWSYNFLAQGERTSFFTYQDRINPKNAKIFCYLKTFNLSPQRVEMHVETFYKYQELIPDIMDLIYYLIIVQGDPLNPQVRLIAIAELYARETLKLININKIIKEVGITPTMNQIRFGR